MAFGEGRIWYDGKFVDWADATTHVMSHVIHYGSSVFESLRCYKTPRGTAAFRIAAHVERFFDSAKIYRMDLGITKQQFTEAILETVRINKLEQCYVRPLAFRGYGEMGVNPLNNPVCLVIAAWDWGTYLGEEALEKGVHAMTSSWNRMAPNTLPALAKAGGNYLNSQLVKMEAHMAGFDEGVVLDVNGYVSEGPGENIFMVRHGVVYTPPTESCILAGITRHSVIVLCREMGIRVEQHVMPREALYLADELFFSGTAAEITPITRLDHITIGNGARGPITTKIQQTFFSIVRGQVPDTHGWLTHV
jgi:branched-chain amino acid aminotransferase